MEKDTDIGGRARRFPATRHSMVEAARSGDPDRRRAAFERVVQAYWKPVYVYLRLRWHAPVEDAKDLTQGFFARAFEKGFFEPTTRRGRVSAPSCARASTAMSANEQAAERRLKRGGGVDVPLRGLRDRGARPAAAIPGPPARTRTTLFHREWVRVGVRGSGRGPAPAVPRQRARAGAGRVRALRPLRSGRRRAAELRRAGRRVRHSADAGDEPARLRAPRVPRRDARDACACARPATRSSATRCAGFCGRSSA